MVAIAVHGVTLLGDGWLRPGLQDILVPFALNNKPVFPGLGVLGGYLAALTGLTFYARKRFGAKRCASCTG